MSKLKPEDETHHSCQKIYGKVYNLWLDSNGNPSCGYCNKDVKWSQVADHLQHYRRRR